MLAASALPAGCPRCSHRCPLGTWRTDGEVIRHGMMRIGKNKANFRGIPDRSLADDRSRSENSCTKRSQFMHAFHCSAFSYNPFSFKILKSLP